MPDTASEPDVLVLGGGIIGLAVAWRALAAIAGSEPAAKAGVTFENSSADEPLVTLRYFGPEVNPDVPEVGDHKR